MSEWLEESTEVGKMMGWEVRENIWGVKGTSLSKLLDNL